MRTDSAWSDDVFQVPASPRRRWPAVVALGVLLALALMVATGATPAATSAPAVAPPHESAAAPPADELEPLPVLKAASKRANEGPPHATLPPIDPLEDRR